MIAFRNIIVLFLILGLFLKFSYAQKNIPFKSSYIKDKKKLKYAKNELKKGDDFFYEARKSFFLLKNSDSLFLKALHHYNLAYSVNSENSELNLKIGECLYNSTNKSLSTNYLNKGLLLKEKLEGYDHFLQAIHLKINGNFVESIKVLKSLKSKLKKKEFENKKKIINKIIKECESAKIKYQKPVDVWIENLSFNSEKDDISPCLSLREDLLIFSSNRNNKNLTNKYNFFDFDIYSVFLLDSIYQVNSISKLNTINDDLTGSLSYDGSMLMFSRLDDKNFDIYESFNDIDGWSDGTRKMGLKSRGPNTENNELFSSFDPPGVKVYFITNGGYSGNNDIYYSGIKNKLRNIWGGVQSAGIEINTKFDEGSVFIHPDGKTMYFSSKGHDSMGGYDIFVSKIDELGQWSKPKNLGFPINSIYDDNYFILNASGRVAYFSSNRPGGKGGYDIFKLTYKGEKKNMISQSENKFFSEVKAQSSALPKINYDENIRQLTVFKGKILDEVTLKPLKTSIKIFDNISEKEYNSFESSSLDGSFLVALPSGKNYGISIELDNYLFHSENFNLPIDSGFNVVEKNILLKNISVGSNIKLSNVFFELDKSNLTNESSLELDRLYNFLNDFKDISIEISGHTDNLGSELYNELLSQKRADAVKNYLVNKGISKNRLKSVGYGKKRPVSSNENEIGRSQNRRTEFKITSN